MRLPARNGIGEQTRRPSPWANGALACASILVSLLLIEGGYRLVANLPLFEAVDWRASKVVRSEYQAVVDPVLGWTVQAWTDSDNFPTMNYGFSTIDHGIRANFKETTVRIGGILAVGDSFTQGWEVDNDETWPSYLEKLAGVPVVNAGVGGYGTDQIILRAEQMLPIVQPKILIIGFLEADMFRTAHSVFGAPKPYFTLEAGELRHHPPELTDPKQERGTLASLADAMRDRLGYSAAADYLLASLAPSYWYGSGQQVSYQRVTDQEGAITCALLRRLKAQTDQAGIPMMLLMQHHAPLLFHTERSTPIAQQVVACAQAADIRVVDQFEPLRAIALENVYEISQYYSGMLGGKLYGHMTAKGNRHAAELLHEALRDWLPRMTGSVQEPAGRAN
jgi:lysophospholipase L1-like esterase